MKELRKTRSAVMNISVVIPLYNKRATIERAINSVLNQSIRPFEIIVINDGSTDGSEVVVKTFADPCIKLYNQSNRGVASARNKGISEARGEWIAFLDADDIWLPDYLRILSGLCSKYPGCNVIASAYFFEDFRGKRSEMILRRISFYGPDGIMENYFDIAVVSHPPLCSSAVIVRKRAIMAINGFPEGISSGEDLITWARLAVSNNIAYSILPLAVFIQDSAHTYDTIPNREPQIPDKVGSMFEILTKDNPGIRGLKKYVALWFKMRASIFLRLGYRHRALEACFRSLRYKPAGIKIYLYILLSILPSGIINRIFRIWGQK